MADKNLKRKLGDDGRDTDRTVRRIKQGSAEAKHVVLEQFFPKLQTLREYVLSNLPAASKLRRKKIASIGQLPSGSETTLSLSEVAVSKLMDSTLVGIPAGHDNESSFDRRWEQWITFSQKGDDSNVTLSEGVTGAFFSQSEIVDFVIWLLFSREKKIGTWPKHLLCDGFRRHVGPKPLNAPTVALSTIPDIFSVYKNDRVDALKKEPWPQLLTLLGKSGEKIIMDLLLDCSIFMPIEAGKGNLYQLSGIPISESEAPLRKKMNPIERTPSQITFVRNRIFYAKPTLNARGLVQFGLRHIHVLNRFPYRRSLPGSETSMLDRASGTLPDANEEGTVHVMMYMFPRQFGLHNVFTSKVDTTQTAQRFQDYTLREEEIGQKFGKSRQMGQGLQRNKIPRRLRGNLRSLVHKLRILHDRCSYTELLRHHCPVKTQGNHCLASKEPKSSTRLQQSLSKSYGKNAKNRRKPRQTGGPPAPIQFSTLDELATPISDVSAFCQAVLCKVIPDAFWGVDATGTQNKHVFLLNVDRLIRLRRFEVFSLHEMSQGIKINDLEWLAPPSLRGSSASRTDVQKRLEIFHEFLYYLVDSILIPLIRSHFYVTESSVHRQRLFYFRHDVWRYVAEPAMAALKEKMFEEVKLEDAIRILDSRELGFGQLRLLPKESSIRPIMNLRRRAVAKGGKKLLGFSINTLLGPVHKMLQLEKSLHPDRLGSTMFSVGDLYPRIKIFKERLGTQEQKFYFAKLDVQGAFDTIPQSAVVELMKTIPSEEAYNLEKYVQIRLSDSTTGSNSRILSKIAKRWQSVVRSSGDQDSLLEMIAEQIAPKRKNTVFIDSVVRKAHNTHKLLALMSSHIQQNLVKIGKKYYRQKNGIPQGSVLSSFLCNYFYADLEVQHLSFLQSEDSLLLRLIDDFLLITTDRGKVVKFVTVMHGGLPQYGVTVHPRKTLVNFDLHIDNVPVSRIQDNQGFPFCGTVLNCKTLEITKDHDGVKDPVISNALTVDYSRRPGNNFKHKVLHAFKIHSHLMFYDTSHNSQQTMVRNVHRTFVETATKMWAYARCLPKEKQPQPRLVIRTIMDLIELAFGLLTSKSRTTRNPGYKCNARKAEIAWLAHHAFKHVLVKKQSRYRAVLGWIEAEQEKLPLSSKSPIKAMIA